MISRRSFLQSAAAAAVVAARVDAHSQGGAARWKLGGFTKPIQDLSFEETARVAADVGWDGIELPLRAGGHVLPARVDDDLPRMAAALRARNQEVLVLATDIKSADPLSEKVLRASARAGIRLYRLGAYRYRQGVSIPSQLAEFRAQLEDLAALNAQIGVTGLLQNHSGNGYVGSALWDLHLLTEGLDSRHIGVHYDIGHATVEGGLSWPTNFALVKDRIGAVIVKDFVWKLTPGRGGATEWCPIGKGMINPQFFSLLKATPFAGPITMQYEYPFGDEAPGRPASLDARMRALKADNAQVRAWLNG